MSPPKPETAVPQGAAALFVRLFAGVMLLFCQAAVGD